MGTSGRCQPGREINTTAECSAAAKDLDLNDESASPDQYGEQNSHTYYYYYYPPTEHAPPGSDTVPPFCYYADGELRFNAGYNRGNCTDIQPCLCSRPVPTTTTSTTTTTTTTTSSTTTLKTSTSTTTTTTTT